MDDKVDIDGWLSKMAGERTFGQSWTFGSLAVYACLWVLAGASLTACGSDENATPTFQEGVEAAQKNALSATGDSSTTTQTASVAVAPTSDVEREIESVQCSVTTENSSLTPERREALRARIDRQAVRATPPNFREREEGPSLEEMNQPPTPFEVRIPPEDVLDRQAAFFERRERATPDLAEYRGARRADISREIEQTRGMTPEDIGRAVQRGDLSFEAAHAIATAEANRDDYREKYDTIGRVGEPTFVEGGEVRR